MKIKLNNNVTGTNNDSYKKDDISTNFSLVGVLSLLALFGFFILCHFLGVARNTEFADYYNVSSQNVMDFTNDVSDDD